MPCSSQSISPNVQQILADAKKLVGRLHDHDVTADTVISQAQGLSNKIDAMKQYQGNINELNNVAHQHPWSTVLVGIQQENRHIRELQQENKELKVLLEEHQATLELIMSKYRDHMMHLITVTKVEDVGAISNPEFNYVLQEQKEKIYKMISIMAQAATVGSDVVAKDQEQLSRIATENKGLRELLDIAVKSGSVKPELAPDAAQQ